MPDVRCQMRVPSGWTMEGVDGFVGAPTRTLVSRRDSRFASTQLTVAQLPSMYWVLCPQLEPGQAQALRSQ